MSDDEGLIDRIYEAAVIPELWPRVLDDISRLSGCFGGVLFTTAAREIMRWTSSEATRSLFESFLANPAAQEDNIRLKHAIAARHHGFFGNHQLYSRAEMDRSLVYTKFFFPNGLGYMAGTVLPMPNGDVAVFDLERRYDDGPVAPEEVRRLDAVRPHLARAAALSTRLNLERARAVVDALGRAGMPAAVLGGQVAVGISGIGEFSQHIKAGRVRAIAVSSGSRLAGVNIPTLKEQGVNVELVNWRGVWGAPGISAEQKKALVAAVEAGLGNAKWKEAVERLDWTSFTLTGDAFGAFVESETKRIGAILDQLSLGAKK